MEHKKSKIHGELTKGLTSLEENFPGKGELVQRSKKGGERSRKYARKWGKKKVAIMKVGAGGVDGQAFKKSKRNAQRGLISRLDVGPSGKKRWTRKQSDRVKKNTTRNKKKAPGP